MVKINAGEYIFVCLWKMRILVLLQLPSDEMKIDNVLPTSLLKVIVMSISNLHGYNDGPVGGRTKPQFCSAKYT